jgi:ATP-binding cassette subfamily C protein LapB
MIFTDSSHALNHIQWLTHECSLEFFAQGRLSAFEYDALIQQLSPQSTKSTLPFFDKLFDAFNLNPAQWSEVVEHEALPVLALIPRHGIVVVNELTPEGKWKYDALEGTGTLENFPAKTLFTSIKAKRHHTKKISASHMFKEIALRQKPFIIYAAIASLSINILALGTSFYSMQVYDRVIPTHGLSTLTMLSIGVFVAILLELILKLARSSILDHASKNMDLAYSHDIFSRFLKIRSDALPKSIGTLSGQLQSYGTVRAFISTAALYVLIDFPFSLIFLTVIVLISGWTMGLIALVFLLVAIIIGLLFKTKIEKLSQTSSRASHQKLGLLVETVENAENVKMSGGGWHILSRWNHLSENAIHDDIEIRHYSELSSYMSAFLQQISYIGLVATGAYLVTTTDTLTMGGLIAVTILSGRILAPIAMLPNLIVQWGRTKIAIKDLDNVYALPSDNEGIDRPLTPSIIQHTLECQNLKFAYTKDALTTNLPKLTINAGEKVAILGSIGSGKSTLLKLLSGLYMPQEGKVLLNGIDMQHISRNKINETISYLPQNIKLLSGTLRNNLLFGMVGISDETIMEKASQTGLIALINTLPQGLDTPIPEGGESVSGGQKQLIVLTRLLITQPKIWLLDEPTSSMDEGSERRIIELLKGRISPEQTLVVVTHKPSLLSLVDRIIVMTPQGIALDGPRDAVLQRLSAPAKAPEQGKNNG